MANGQRPRPAVWLLLAFLVLGIVGQAVPLYTDWLWFHEVGYAQVFTTVLTLRGWLVLGLGLAVWVFLFANLWIAARTAPPTSSGSSRTSSGCPAARASSPSSAACSCRSPRSSPSSPARGRAGPGTPSIEYLQRHALRPGGPDLRARPRLLLLRAAVLAPPLRLGHRARGGDARPHRRGLRAPAEPRPHRARPAAGRRRAHPSPRPGRAPPRPARGRLLARPLRPPLLDPRGRLRRLLRGRQCRAARVQRARRAGPPLRGGLPRADEPAGLALPGGRSRGAGGGVGGRPRPLSRRAAAPAREAERAGLRAPLHPAQHPHDPPRLRARPRPGEGLPRRGEPQRGRARAERPDHQEHPPVGPPAAAHDLRPAPGDPHLLQVPRRGQRPLHAQRRVPPGHAVAPGAVLPAPARPAAELDQRAPDLHPRLRPGGGAGEPDQPGGAARVLRQGHPAGGDGVPEDHPARDVLRRVRQRLRLRPHPVAGARLSLRRPERLHQVRGPGRHPGGLLPVASSPSPRDSARSRSSSPTTSRRRAGS